jgi:hypothetical protein
MKHYAKKREAVRAVQWTGSMTPEMTALLELQHSVHIDSARQLVFANATGPGRFAREGDWIVSSSGEDFTVIGDEVFRNVYEEVDETARALLPPTDDEHEAAGKEFVQKLDDLLAAGLRLTREEHRAIFRDRDQLVRCLRHLLEDHAWVAARREQARIREKIIKELWP